MLYTFTALTISLWGLLHLIACRDNIQVHEANSTTALCFLYIYFYDIERETCFQQWLFVPCAGGLQCPALGSDNWGCWRWSVSLLTSGWCLRAPGPQHWHSFKSLLVPLQCPMQQDGQEPGSSDPRRQNCPTWSPVPLRGPWGTSIMLTGRFPGSSLSGNRWIFPKQNWESWHFTCPAVSRWAKKSFRLNRRRWQLVIIGPQCWRDSQQKVRYWEALVLGLEGKILTEDLLRDNYSFYVFFPLGFVPVFIDTFWYIVHI